MTNKLSYLTIILQLTMAMFSTAINDGYSRQINETEADVTIAGTLTSIQFNGEDLNPEIVPWGIVRVGASKMYNQNEGEGVKVAVLDTGIDLDHPDILVAGNVTFVEGTIDGNDDHGHGTEVAGIITARINGIGIVGIAPKVKLYAVKVLNSKGEGDLNSVEKGINWAIANKMQIINMSFGSVQDWSPGVREALKRANEANIILVAAAGSGEDPAGENTSLLAPARYSEVISVGAIDRYDRRVTKSRTGDNLTLVGPGEAIFTTFKSGGYGYGGGTSMAAPHVTGVVAILLAAGLPPGEVKPILQETAQKLGDRTLYGAGLVNAPAALELAKERVDSYLH